MLSNDTVIRLVVNNALSIEVPRVDFLLQRSVRVSFLGLVNTIIGQVCTKTFRHAVKRLSARLALGLK